MKETYVALEQLVPGDIVLKYVTQLDKRGVIMGDDIEIPMMVISVGIVERIAPTNGEVHRARFVTLLHAVGIDEGRYKTGTRFRTLRASSTETW